MCVYCTYCTAELVLSDIDNGKHPYVEYSNGTKGYFCDNWEHDEWIRNMVLRGISDSLHNISVYEKSYIIRNIKKYLGV